MEKYNIVVIGAGHAGCEAALALARLKQRTLLVTMRIDRIAHISCNPSIGGVGKGQLVKEIDALGGEMAKAADATGIHFRTLNTSRGPAVWSSRVQIDRHKYSEYMSSVIATQDGLTVLEDEATAIVTDRGKVISVTTKNKGTIKTEAVVITTGTFLNGLIHIGLEHRPGGRYGEEASLGLSKSLKDLGFEMGRLKTGTPARLKRESIDFERLQIQPGDERPTPLSFSTEGRLENRMACYIAYTNPRTHSIIKKNLDRSPLYTGIIKSTGVRYCPSIEDKVVRFPDRDRHQVFLEPEGIDTEWYYPNGISTSLPSDLQQEIVNSIEGLEKAEILRPGYGIEYEYAQPTQLFPTLETKLVAGLYFAGQINGTTGYEEAAAQGLTAGINAGLKLRQKGPLILDRANSYIGVLIDDLVTKGTSEPYRMFTSRVEYRLMLREDNADIRLREHGHKIGLVKEEEFLKTKEKKESIDRGIKELNSVKVRPNGRINRTLRDLNTSGITKIVFAAELLRRPQITYATLKDLNIVSSSLQPAHERIVELLVKYDGFIKRQESDIRRMRDVDKIRIPEGLDYSKVSGLSCEIVEKLCRVNPHSLGQASRISGITPAAIMLLMVYLKKYTSGCCH